MRSGTVAEIEPLTELVDPATYREAMSRLVAPVHVVTTAGPAGRCGITASAVTSVSDDPPTVLV
jgi:flavin reductase (DIM6/NTAB) family NADH-FMN oxidoreductase RutF